MYNKMGNYELGDIIPITMTGLDEPIEFTVIGKNVDGDNTITIGANNAVSVINWNGDSDEPAEWKDCYLRTWLHTEFYMKLPKDVRYRVVPVLQKRRGIENIISIREDKVWIPSLSQVGGGDDVVEGVVYPYIKEHPEWLFNKEVIGVGIQCDWWLSTINPDNLEEVAIMRYDNNLEHYVGVVPFMVLATR